MDPLKMYFLLNKVIFHCYVSLPEGNHSLNMGCSPHPRKALRWDMALHLLQQTYQLRRNFHTTVSCNELIFGETAELQTKSARKIRLLFHLQIGNNTRKTKRFTEFRNHPGNYLYRIVIPRGIMGIHPGDV